LSLGLLLIAASGAIVVLRRYQSKPLITRGAERQYSVTTSSGASITDLFDSNEPNGLIYVGASFFNDGPTRRKTKCAVNSGFIGYLDYLLDVQSVTAVTCTGDPCAGSWMWPSFSVECGSDCQGFDNRYVTNAMLAEARDGYRYSGSAACTANDGSGSCNCQEIHCIN
jgi:hypothetical protein